MLKKSLITILSVFMLILLNGCASAGSDLVLTEVGNGQISMDEAVTPDIGDDAKETSKGDTNRDIEEAAKQEEKPETVAVFVCGAVENPGVYELLEGSRADEAVEAAGGFTDDADVTYVNLAAKLTDGVKLQIPTVTDTASKGLLPEIDSFDAASDALAADGSGAGGLVNINTASKEQLTSLPGIGDGIAGKIIKYREDNGAFKKAEDIMNVSGIKEKLFSKIKDYITV
ncbi:MAG: helix-hairpin-helix domain-containing protein [Butyrivibrio sp.]|nr:helix-hairpin-helix domain-containing protein [Butyrivibrio sp.]